MDWGEIAIDSDENVITWAEIRYATYGVHFYGTAGNPSALNTVSYTTFTRCGAEPEVADSVACAGVGPNEGGAITGDYVNNSTFTQLTVTYGESGIWLSNSDTNKLQLNTFRNLQQSAIRLAGDSDSNSVTNNTMLNVEFTRYRAVGHGRRPGQ